MSDRCVSQSHFAKQKLLELRLDGPSLDLCASQSHFSKHTHTHTNQELRLDGPSLDLKVFQSHFLNKMNFGSSDLIRCFIRCFIHCFIRCFKCSDPIRSGPGLAKWNSKDSFFDKMYLEMLRSDPGLAKWSSTTSFYQ